MIKGKIESIAFGGEGIMRHDGLVIFVPFTAPGDIATVEIVSKKKNFAHAKLIVIDQPSPNRTTPQCPYFGICGGCQLQHLLYPAQNEVKQTFISDALKRIAKVETPPVSVIPATVQWHYRRHIRLKLKKTVEGFQVGYTGCDNSSLIEIEQCPIFLPTGDPFFSSLKPLLKALSSEDIEECSLRVIKTTEGKFILAFSFTPSLPKNNAICQTLWCDLWQGITMHSPKEQKQWGGVVCETEVLGLKAQFSAFGFVQNHPEQSEKLYQTILEFLPDEAEKILDLYCGIGLTSLLFARLGKTVTGVESHPETIELAKTNAKTNKLGATFQIGRSEAVGVEILKKERPDTVLCNPPRTGLDSSLIKAFLEERPACILYVSCMPATLARDLQQLVHGGYYVDKIQGFDMFPQTTHVETLVRLRNVL